MSSAKQVPISWLDYFITPKCYNKLFVDRQLESECLKAIISKFLGYLIILGSILVKVPQILKIVKANSAEGLSLVGIVLELIAVSGTLAYSYANNFPFSSYGEAAFMTFQQIIIMYLVVLYGQNFRTAVIYTSVYGVALGYLMSPQVPLHLLTLLQASVVALIVFSRLSQALTNYQNSGTGQLSFVTVFLQFAGSSVRILTSLHETGDPMTIFMFVMSSFTNAILLGQIIKYWNGPGNNTNVAVVGCVDGAADGVAIGGDSHSVGVNNNNNKGKGKKVN
ncbi:hypothetical protein HELRODRAFT_185227 [Helobdella robusta]|uniref:Mannose-P-dolichol utilization defect 1 protein homolog n=1 Tax=Helobdella robusta TaxID=6412 RepID=T1FMJ2_HELRO|nr:hypothetical protein HELRODRAFT_185227 [Helobdella robusta]ESN90763.1 hypothetical protein HELRODRAFT_185227 [Helobdella robusta]